MEQKYQILALVFALISSPTLGEELPPPIKSPILDETGVELKSGRYGGLVIDQVSIGGEGSYLLKRSYAPQDGRDLVYQNIFSFYKYQVVEGVTSYDYVDVRYPGGSLTFRRRTGSSGSYEAEYNTGATLDQNLNFTDKYGVKIQGAKLSYPDGREIWGGVQQPGQDPVNIDIPEIRNNFGFRLRGGSAGFQAINMAYDYCDYDYSHACTGLKKNRSGSFNRISPTEARITDASGGITRVFFTGIYAFDNEPKCYTSEFGQPPFCSGTSITHYYPAGVIRPGENSQSLSLSYSRYGGEQTVSHAEVLISRVVAGGVTTDYQNAYDPNGSFGGPCGFQSTIRSNVANLGYNYSRASSCSGVWPSPKMALNYFNDRLGRRTSFEANSLGEISKIIHPEGDSVENIYGARFNVIEIIQKPKTGSGESPLSTRFVYESACTSVNLNWCNKPIAKIGPRGERADYTYNTRGQITSETGPPPNSGSVRPRTVYEYAMRLAMVLVPNGTFVAAGSPISLLSKKTICQDASNCASGIDRVVIEYDYGSSSGPNNLLLRSQSTTAYNSAGALEVHTVCYQYNYFGEKIAETAPRAGVTACQ